MEKFVCLVALQLVAYYLDRFREQLIIEFETYFNGEKMHHNQIAQAIGDILDRSIGMSLKNLKISF